MKNLINTNLIKNLGLDNLSPEDQEKLILRISDTLYEAIIARSLGKLSSKDKTELEYMLAHNPTSESLGAFIYEKVPQIDQIAEEEITSFKKIVLSTYHTAFVRSKVHSS